MKSKILGLVAMVGCIFAFTNVNASVITFDDIVGSFVPQGYQGFSWLGRSDATSWVSGLQNPIDSNGGYSGAGYAWSNGGGRLDMIGASIFGVDSLWLRNRSDVFSQNITIEGFLGSNSLFSWAGTITNSWSQITLNFAGIDKLVINGLQNTLVDDIALRAVPEPGTLALLGLGLLGLGATRRKAA